MTRSPHTSAPHRDTTAVPPSDPVLLTPEQAAAKLAILATLPPPSPLATPAALRNELTAIRSARRSAR
ncbi:MAG: hypothetical protein FJW40_25130 [Acidobacteria bacterium]|nr:hypothetical protein [Acidobacteriota bacterium]